MQEEWGMSGGVSAKRVVLWWDGMVVARDQTASRSEEARKKFFFNKQCLVVEAVGQERKLNEVHLGYRLT